MLPSAFVSIASIPSFPPHLVGNATAVYDLLERVLPGSSSHFDLAIVPAREAAGTKNSFTISDAEGGKTRITGTTASELTGGLGVYLREYWQKQQERGAKGGSGLMTKTS